MNIFSFLNKHLNLFFFFIILQPLCSQTIEDAFLLAGNNKENLQAVLNYYKKRGENQKYEAALFLIKNLPIQETQTYQWEDASQNVVPFSEFDYEDFSIAEHAFNKLKDSINIKPRVVVEKDIEIIPAQLLIDNIDLAFKAWKNNPWSSSYSFNTFCEYILPYRSLIEPLEDWRAEYNFLVARAKTNLDDASDPVEVCTRVINELKGFSFSLKRSPISSVLLSPQQLLFRRQGSCPELANLALLSARSLGIAVSFDYTPHYGASSNRHYWNTVIDKKGNHIPFNGSSPNSDISVPYQYKLNNKRIAKVFRSTYSIQKSALASKIKKEDIPYSFLNRKNIIDVTQEYVSIGTINHAAISKDSISIAYLNVFNLHKWRIIDWTEKKGNYFTFTNVGRDLVYLPSYYRKGQSFYEQYPILLKKNGEEHILKPNFSKAFECTISRVNEFKNDYKETNSLHLDVGEVYTLFYWDKTWQKIGVSKATIDGVFFKDVPKNALLFLLPLTPNGYERVFTLDAHSEKIIWY